MHWVEEYWKVQVACLIILLVLVAVMFFIQRSNNQEANETSNTITYTDMLGIA